MWAALAQSVVDTTLGAGTSATEVLDRADSRTLDLGVNPFGALQLGISRCLVEFRTGEASDAYRSGSGPVTSSSAEYDNATPPR